MNLNKVLLAMAIGLALTAISEQEAAASDKAPPESKGDDASPDACAPPTDNPEAPAAT